MNVKHKILLEIIAESAGKHPPAERTEISIQPIKPKTVRTVSHAPKRVRKQAEMKPKTEPKTEPDLSRDKIDEYLEILGGMID